MKTTRKSKINENALRLMLRKEIVKLLEADEEQEAPEQEEQPEPEEEPQEEEGLDPKLEAITSGYIRKLKDSGVQVGTEELVEMLSSVIERFTDSSEQKLNILKSIKINIVR
tara:strand:+ start:494 stop:829 length:336 start_codon:yes stop_codon:yes gene_type:complete